MKYDAEIICRRTEYGTVSEWKGPKRGVAPAYLEDIHPFVGDGRSVRLGELFSLGRLRLRVVDTSLTMISTKVGVMLESPHAQLYWLYREKAEKIVMFVRRCELAVRAFQGTLRIGETLAFTSKLADKLL